jgi:hypothetical protein
VQIRVLRLAIVLLLALSFGCATSGGGSDVRAPLVAGTDLTSFRALALEVAPNSGVTLPAGSADRIRMEVAERVAKKAPGRFTNGPDAVPALEAELTITRYDEGNTFLPRGGPDRRRRVTATPTATLSTPPEPRGSHE